MRKLILLVAAAACVVPAAALAAKPAKDSSFQHCSSKNVCPFGFETSKDGRKIVNLKLYNDCSAIPAVFPSIKVRKGGKFSKSGRVKDAVGNEIQFKVQGRFVTPKKARGTYDADSKGCSSKPKDFTAKRVGKAQPGL